MTILPEAATDIASWVFILIAVLVVVAGAALFFVGRRKRAASTESSREAMSHGSPNDEADTEGGTDDR